MPCTSAEEYIKPHALLHAYAEWCCLSGRKMRQFRVLLLLLICQLATPIPIFDKDGAGFHSGYQSAGFGESIRDWFRVLKNRIVTKWQDWFGNDGALPSLSPQDILNIDKTIESRVSSYPGLLLDLSDLSYDPKYDWGVRVGNWHIIRKVTGNNILDDNSDSDEWDMRPLMPNLPSPPMFGIDWPPNIYEFGISETMRPPTTTPKIELTTLRQYTPQTVIQTESILTSTESIATSSESAVISTEPIPFTTESLTTSTEPIVTSTEKILTSSESVISNDEPGAITTDPIAISAEPIPLTTPSIITSTEPIVTPTQEIVSSTESATNSEPISRSEPTSESTISSTESTMISTESIVPSTESITTSSRSIITFTEPTLINTELTMASTEKMVTTTELSATSTELILPVYNKRIEQNKTVSTTRKPSPASAEVIMF